MKALFVLVLMILMIGSTLLLPFIRKVFVAINASVSISISGQPGIDTGGIRR